MAKLPLNQLQQELRALSEAIELFRQGDLAKKHFKPVACTFDGVRSQKRLRPLVEEKLQPALADYLDATACVAANLSYLRLFPIYAGKHAMLAENFEGDARPQKKAFMDGHYLTEWYWDTCARYGAIRPQAKAGPERLAKIDALFNDALFKGEDIAHRRYGLLLDSHQNGIEDLNALTQSTRYAGQACRNLAGVELGAAFRLAKISKKYRRPEHLFDGAQEASQLIDIADNHLSNARAWIDGLSATLERLYRANWGMTHPVPSEELLRPC